MTHSFVDEQVKAVAINLFMWTNDDMTDQSRPFTGTVRFRNERGAYGFIERDGPGSDVFVHVRNVIRGELTEGSSVKFDIESSERGPRAENVVIVN
jgi:CspA family cold shock protein